MKLPDLFVNAVTTFDGKALAKGQKQIGGFEKTVKNLAKTFGVAFSAAAVVQFGKASFKAFAEDEKAAARLTQSVKNLGLGFEDARIKTFISDLEAAAGVADDVLRPAFQALLQTTGSVARSQELLTLALDISAGSGVDVAEVAKDLSMAYLGQTKGLSKYNTGLTKAELSVAGFTKLQKKLNEQYSGQNAERLKTIAGQMEFLGVAAGNAQETIGKGLVDALMILTGDTTVQELADTMKEAADNTATLVTNLAKVAKALNGPINAVAGSMAWFIEHTQKYVDLIVAGDPSGFLSKPVTKTPGTGARSASPAGTFAASKARAKAEADATRRAKELLALTKKQQIADKNKLSLSKAAAVFDSTRISIAAALQATYDKETRLRLEALMAIEDDNGELALKKINELAALQKNADMAKLAGVTQISEATLAALNTQLLTELKGINDSKMAESDKEAARQIAFGKYNAAITAAGELAAKESYSERVQIQLTEIARLASLSKTTNAALTLTKLRESEELSMIDRVAKAQAAADAARLKALQDYIALLGKVGSGGNTAGLTKSGIGSLIPAAATFKTVDDFAALTENLPSSVNAFDLFSTLTPDQQAGLGGYSPYMNYGSGYAQTYNININAGAIAAQDEFAGLIQDTIQRLNRGGDPLTTAGVL